MDSLMMKEVRSNSAIYLLNLENKIPTISELKHEHIKGPFGLLVFSLKTSRNIGRDFLSAKCIFSILTEA